MWSFLAAIVSLLVNVFGWFGFGRASKEKKALQEAVKANEFDAMVDAMSDSERDEWLRKSPYAKR